MPCGIYFFDVILHLLVVKYHPKTVDLGRFRREIRGGISIFGQYEAGRA